MGKQEPMPNFMKKIKDIFIEHYTGKGHKFKSDTNFSMKWEYSLKYEQIQKIQNDCEVTLKTLGYKLI